MKNVLLLVSVFVSVTVRPTAGLGNLLSGLGIAGKGKLLELTLGSSESHDITGNVQLAQQLTLEANIILAEIQKCMESDCDFNTSLSAKIDDVKIKVGILINILATCIDDKILVNLLRSAMTNLEMSLVSLETEIINLRNSYQQQCQNLLTQILQSVSNLRGCVNNKVSVIYVNN